MPILPLNRNTSLTNHGTQASRCGRGHWATRRAALGHLLLLLYDAVLEGKANHLHGRGNAQFVEDIRLVTIDRTEGDVELLGDLFAQQT